MSIFYFHNTIFFWQQAMGKNSLFGFEKQRKNLNFIFEQNETKLLKKIICGMKMTILALRNNKKSFVRIGEFKISPIICIVFSLIVIISKCAWTFFFNYFHILSHKQPFYHRHRELINLFLIKIIIWIVQHIDTERKNLFVRIHLTCFVRLMNETNPKNEWCHPFSTLTANRSMFGSYTDQNWYQIGLNENPCT